VQQLRQLQILQYQEISQQEHLTSHLPNLNRDLPRNLLADLDPVPLDNEDRFHPKDEEDGLQLGAYRRVEGEVEEVPVGALVVRVVQDRVGAVEIVEGTGGLVGEGGDLLGAGQGRDRGLWKRKKYRVLTKISFPTTSKNQAFLRPVEMIS